MFMNMIFLQLETVFQLNKIAKICKNEVKIRYQFFTIDKWYTVCHMHTQVNVAGELSCPKPYKYHLKIAPGKKIQDSNCYRSFPPFPLLVFKISQWWEFSSVVSDTLTWPRTVSWWCTTWGSWEQWPPFKSSLTPCFWGSYTPVPTRWSSLRRYWMLRLVYIKVVSYSIILFQGLFG